MKSWFNKLWYRIFPGPLEMVFTEDGFKLVVRRYDLLDFSKNFWEDNLRLSGLRYSLHVAKDTGRELHLRYRGQLYAATPKYPTTGLVGNMPVNMPNCGYMNLVDQFDLYEFMHFAPLNLTDGSTL